MHNQPNVSVNDLWAPGAAEHLAQLIEAQKLAKPGRSYRSLLFGAGEATQFMLEHGLQVTMIEADDARAAMAQGAAQASGLADQLTHLPSIDELGPDESLRRGFDAALISGPDRLASLQTALDLLADNALILLEDTHLPAHWSAYHWLLATDCTVFQSAQTHTAIWHKSTTPQSETFAHHSFVRHVRSDESLIEPDRILIPKSYASAEKITPTFTVLKELDDLPELETRLQRLGLIPRRGTYGSPQVTELQDTTVWIKEGHKYFGRDGEVYRQHRQVVQQYDPPFELAEPVDLPGRTLDLSTPGAGRYSFFLLDSLPKLHVAKEAGFDLGTFDTILVNTGAKWMRATMASVLGHEGPPIRFFNPQNPAFRMERSLHLEGVRLTRFTPDWLHAYIDELFAADAAQSSIDQPSFGKHVYISRQRAKGRQIVNHEAFLEMVSQLGFVEVFAEDYTPRDLAMRLRQTDILLSPHGAGLANLVFCPPTARVIELFSSHYTSQYITLARDRRQPYEAFLCPDEEGLTVFDRYENVEGSRAIHNRRDLVVPIDALRTRLEALIR
ncbi:MAG: glycosyltransferase family 61 protein [Pseudomonadota bacterium]